MTQIHESYKKIHKHSIKRITSAIKIVSTATSPSNDSKAQKLQKEDSHDAQHSEEKNSQPYFIFLPKKI